MKYVFFSMLMFCCISSFGQSKQEQKLLNSVESFRQGLISGKRVDLASLVSDKLSYGHSSGKIDDKETFLVQLESGASDFVTASFNNQVIQINGGVALVRHELKADINDKGVPGTIRLHVLLVWQKENKTWKLLARQATRLP